MENGNRCASAGDRRALSNKRSMSHWNAIAQSNTNEFSTQSMRPRWEKRQTDTFGTPNGLIIWPNRRDKRASRKCHSERRFNRQVTCEATSDLFCSAMRPSSMRPGGFSAAHSSVSLVHIVAFHHSQAVNEYAAPIRVEPVVVLTYSLRFTWLECIVSTVATPFWRSRIIGWVTRIRGTVLRQVVRYLHQSWTGILPACSWAGRSEKMHSGPWPCTQRNRWRKTACKEVEIHARKRRVSVLLPNLRIWIPSENGYWIDSAHPCKAAAQRNRWRRWR